MVDNDNEGKLCSKIYDNYNNLDLPMIMVTFLSINIPASHTYRVLYSIWYTIINPALLIKNVLNRRLLITWKIVKSWLWETKTEIINFNNCY